MTADLNQQTPVLIFTSRGMFATPRFANGEVHVHACPWCSVDEACTLPCSHHLDIDMAEGPPRRGAACACSWCAEDDDG